jgi:methylthioribose-1-phosphate isomerase
MRSCLPAPSFTAKADPAPYHAGHAAGARAHIEAIDQRALPHAIVTAKIADADTAALAIRKMWVRGAPLFGAVAAYGLAMALDRDASDSALAQAYAALDATRPTAINLRWALNRVRTLVTPLREEERADAAWREADAPLPRMSQINHAIGMHGLVARESSSKERRSEHHDHCKRR